MNSGHLLQYFPTKDRYEVPSIAECVFGKLWKGGLPEIEISRSYKDRLRVKQMSNRGHSLKLQFSIDGKGQELCVSKDKSIFINSFFFLNHQIVHHLYIVVKRLQRYFEGLSRHL